DKGAQTGKSTLKVTYNSGSSTVRIMGPSGVSIPAGTTVSFYLYVDTSTNVSWANPFVKTGSSTEGRHDHSSSNLLKGSWNVVNVPVPSRATGSQVGVEFQTSGAFTAYVDSVTW